MSQKVTRPTGSRGGIACHRCHDLKIKCDGGNKSSLPHVIREYMKKPCKKCRSKSHQCTYPVRDRNLTVSEFYLNSLRSELQELRQQVSSSRHNGPSSMRSNEPESSIISSNAPRDPITAGRTVEDPTAENFLCKLRELLSTHLPSNFPSSYTGRPPRTSHPRPSTSRSDSSQSYSYVGLRSDISSSKLFVELPPFIQTTQFLDTFDLIMGPDYHWFLRNSFRKQVETLYQDPNCPYARDRIWLSRLLATLAIGQSYVYDSPLVIRLDGSTAAENAGVAAGNLHNKLRKSTTPPGTELFEQALNLLHIPYEEPLVEHVEVLNLISFYCYSLNRRKTAFVYAGLCLRLSNIIGLDKPAGAQFSNLEKEHRKRLWWSSYCLDKITSTEMGWKPACTSAGRELSYPSNEGLSETDLEEFHDPGFLTAQAQLIELKLRITETAYKLKSGGTVDGHEIIACLNTLLAWKSDLAPNVALDLTSGIPRELCNLRTLRTSASLFLRYNHCMILLLRPFLLQEMAHAIDGSAVSGCEAERRHFGETCLQSARHSLMILNDLSKFGLLAKYGFWESLQLFSSLSIVALTNLINKQWPALLGLTLVYDDQALYTSGREILQDMSSVGNFASEDHLRMLVEIESLVKPPETLEDVIVGMPEFSFDVAEWQNIFFDSDVGANEIDISLSSENVV
ncbi:hypothetical protein F5884DRAFT_744574 [Xylogone sp. PMI_703]|nr:hypothetical protein F5884DRAFT_744574 [Xylogone sp. PMI_703]